MIVIYTRKGLERWMDGRRLFGPIVAIDPKHKGNEAIKAHERTHVKQWWRNPFRHTWRYKWDKDYRLACEVEAYKAQLECIPYYDYKVRKHWYATALTTRYGFNLTMAQALQRLS